MGLTSPLCVSTDVRKKYFYVRGNRTLRSAENYMPALWPLQTTAWTLRPLPSWASMRWRGYYATRACHRGRPHDPSVYAAPRATLYQNVYIVQDGANSADPRRSSCSRDHANGACSTRWHGTAGRGGIRVGGAYAKPEHAAKAAGRV